MSIQYCCAQCGQPIEVDSEHGGRTAACPYCRHVQVVPPQSTYRADQAVTARPADAPELPVDGPALAGSTPLPATERPPFIPAPQRRTANTFGTYGLICGGLALLLFGGSIIGFGVLALQSGALPASGAPSPEQVEKVQKLALQQPWLLAAEFGGLFFAVVGLVFGIVSLTQTRWNWRGTTCAAVCGLLLLCVCAAGLVGALGAFGAPQPPA